MSGELSVEVRGDHIVVSRPGTSFSVIYSKPDNEPVLRVLSATWEPGADRQTLFVFRATAFAVAMNKARELGWIV
jgi:hypothetical protein